ncbi:hypothetical protein LCGC14_2873570 [marine sediment metagenome]|uniref:Uncharacterized protein n=1 Tax=marine sediment metagenome TaxID=412755 RepID=A0A0F8Y2D8_9ZZZZ
MTEDAETPQDAPEKSYLDDVKTVLQQTEELSKGIIDKMMDGTLDQAQGSQQLAQVHNSAAEIGRGYGAHEQAQAYIQDQGQRSGMSDAKIKSFQKRAEKAIKAGQRDESIDADFADALQGRASQPTHVKDVEGKSVKKSYGAMTAAERGQLSSSQRDAIIAREEGRPAPQAGGSSFRRERPRRL